VISRLAVTIGGGAFGMVLVPGSDRWKAIAGLLLLIAWTAGYGWLILRTTALWPVLADWVFLGGFVITQGWTVPDASIKDGSGWIFALLSMAVVSYQWHTSTVTGFSAALLLVGCFIMSTRIELGDVATGWVATALWVLAEASLSRGLFLLVRRGGRISDGYLAERERVQQQAALSRARRSDELTYLADLHDTAAATFLMIGAGTVSGPEPWLAEQARRDLRVLRGDRLLVDEGETAAEGTLVDLGALLTRLLAEIEFRVDHQPLRPIRLPAGPAEAICDSVREALVNVQRHAGVDRATLTMIGGGLLVSRVSGTRLLVEIRDGGRGFDPSQVSPHRRGIGESITARMQRAGGHAVIDSTPGRGTVVRLEWPDV
jgi:signal transduction histidine kinase